MGIAKIVVLHLTVFQGSNYMSLVAKSLPTTPGRTLEPGWVELPAQCQKLKYGGLPEFISGDLLGGRNL